MLLLLLSIHPNSGWLELVKGLPPNWPEALRNLSPDWEEIMRSLPPHWLATWRQLPPDWTDKMCYEQVFSSSSCKQPS